MELNTAIFNWSSPGSARGILQASVPDLTVNGKDNHSPTRLRVAYATGATRLPDLPNFLQNSDYLQTISFSFHRFIRSLKKMRKIVSFSEIIIKRLSSGFANTAWQLTTRSLISFKLARQC